MAGAPQIERKIAAVVTASVEDIAGPQVTVATDGRFVTLSGTAAGAAQRDQILNAVARSGLVAALNDRIVVVETVSPFTFMAVRQADGQVKLSGYVPTEAAQDSLLAAASEASGGAPVMAELEVAAGVPDAGWVKVASTGIVALGSLAEGSFSLSDLDATIAGRAADESAIDEIRDMVSSVGPATWGLAIEGTKPLADPFLFSAFKTADGAIAMTGNAPDEETAEVLRTASIGAGSGQVEGELEVARGMPDNGWPSVVRQGLDALAEMESGFLNVSGMSVTLSGEIASVEGLERIRPLIGEGWAADLTVLETPPTTVVTIELDRDGNLTASGLLPQGLEADAFASMVPGLDVAGLEPEQSDEVFDWAPPAEALNIILPRLSRATTTIADQSLVIEGVMKRDFSAEVSVAAVETVMPQEWTLELDLRDAPPLAAITFSKSEDELALTGVLPEPLSTETVLASWGDTASGEALSSGGEGDADAWARMLEVLEEGVALFSTATGEISADRLQLTGVLLAGYSANEVQAWLSEKLGEAWTLDLTADETAPIEGNVRTALATGTTETFRGGFWVPNLTFEVSAEQCGSEVVRALAGEQIQFLSGSAQLDQNAGALLARLAAVVERCLDAERMSLEIAGHTDNIGEASWNQTLSEARAQAVLAALQERGVGTDEVTAKGYGETSPIATNGNRAGRAQNRRIDFVWLTTPTE